MANGLLVQCETAQLCYSKHIWCCELDDRRSRPDQASALLEMLPELQFALTVGDREGVEQPMLEHVAKINSGERSTQQRSNPRDCDRRHHSRALILTRRGEGASAQNLVRLAQSYSGIGRDAESRRRTQDRRDDGSGDNCDKSLRSTQSCGALMESRSRRSWRRVRLARLKQI